MDTDEILTLLQDAAAEAITPRFRALTDEQVIEKAPGDLVTVADREAEVLIASRLGRTYPDALILGEEATAKDTSLLTAFAGAEHSFTIDPVDGTSNFVHGSPDFSVMVGELRQGEPVRGWMWEPENGVAYVAEVGGGVYRNGVRLGARPRSEDPASLRGASSTEIQGMAPGPLARVREPRWSAGLDYGEVCTGEVDYVLFRYDWPWDHVPGALMVAELGGHTGWLDGTAYDPRLRHGWLLTAASQAIFTTARGPVAAALGR